MNYNDDRIEANSYINEIKQILSQARKKAYSAVNFAMIEAYWFTGKRIVEEEQSGNKRAGYGKEILKKLSEELTSEFGKGFSERSLREFRQFYNLFPGLLSIGEIQTEQLPDANQQTATAGLLNPIWRTVFAKLHWSHFQRVLRVPDEKARIYYLTEAAQQNWSISKLDRNISTLYYHRLLSSQIKGLVEKEMLDKTSEFNNETFEFIKNPSVLEFLNLPTNTGYTELELEKALIDNLQKFLLELGKGYAFVERQQLIRTETSDFYIDLVFYNYILKCFVIIELKTNKITHQDIGQIDMYVRMYDDLKKQETDNPTVGILLCTETDNIIAKYSVLNQNQQLFTSKYLPYLPTEEELVAEIEREKINIKLQFGL
jgi:predicted nuclease of restriction endonuclease-like (RecB) superfamily